MFNIPEVAEPRPGRTGQFARGATPHGAAHSRPQGYQLPDASPEGEDILGQIGGIGSVER